MKSPGPVLEILPSGTETRLEAIVTRLAWVVSVVALGLVLVTGALAFDLHNQRKRLEVVSAQLTATALLRDAESKNLASGNATAEATLGRLRELLAERESDLKKLNEAYTQREPLAKQAGDMQQKIEELAKNLLDLAKTDADCREIVRKYNIQQGNPTPGTTAPKP